MPGLRQQRMRVSQHSIHAMTPKTIELEPNPDLEALFRKNKILLQWGEFSNFRNVQVFHYPEEKASLFIGVGRGKQR